jgi:predicted exporter
VSGLARALGWLWLLVVLACAAALTQRVLGARDGNPLLETDLLALLPATERSPLDEKIVARLADAAGGRAVFLVRHREPEQAQAGAREFAARLRMSEAFRNVTDVVPLPNPVDIMAFYHPYRFGLLAPADDAVLAGGPAGLAQRLLERLHRPVPAGFRVPITDDPYGLTSAWLARAPWQRLQLRPDDGLLTVRDEAGTAVLITAEPAGSVFDDAVQRRVLTAIADAERGLAPGTTLLRTGTVFYGAAMREQAEREMDRIGLISLAGIAVLMLALFRSLLPLALSVLSVAVGLTMAVAITLLAGGRLHVITLVFGASLIGEAVDYAIQFFAARASAGPAWQAPAGIAALRPGLITALATSVAGYLALFFVPLPAVSQLALFALAGLAAAFLTVLLWLPRLAARPPKTVNGRAFAALADGLRTICRVVTPRRAAGLAAVIFAIAAAGWSQLATDDNVRLLIHRPANLEQQEAAIRSAIGFSGESRFFVVEATTPEAALQTAEKLTERLRALQAMEALKNWQSVSDFVPSAQRQRQAQTLLRQAAGADSGRALEQAGIASGPAQQWARELAADAPVLTLDRWLQAPWSVPFRHLWQADGTAAVITLTGIADATAVAAAAQGLDGVRFVDKTGSVTQLFGRLRQLGSLWLAVACGIVCLVLAYRYGLRDGLAVLAPTLLGLAAAPGLAALCGVQYSLFSVMALLLVLGVGVNYAIFLKEGGARTGAALAGVIASAITTLLSFGLLALSATPALSRFGITLAAGIGVAVLLAPLALIWSRKPACD